jgi:hypothetical protein
VLTEFDLSINLNKAAAPVSIEGTTDWRESVDNEEDRSVILAPFNSTIDEKEKFKLEPGLPLSNKLIRYASKVREANR